MRIKVIIHPKKVIIFMILIGANLLSPLTASSLSKEKSAVTTVEKPKFAPQGTTVTTSSLPNGVTGVTGSIYIDASPEKVWSAITDYDNQKNFVPKIIDSGLISDNGSEQIMFEKGKTGVLFFTKTVYLKLSIHGDYPERLAFHQVGGDFKVYHGEWVVNGNPGCNGTLLTFKAMIKPDFFAPPFFVKKVQEHDLPMVLTAMKKRAEALGATITE
jgi:carbon monoxide dehydrogenase subunit G